MDPEIAEIYGNKVRIRVMGLCWQAEALLMVNHKMGDGELWSPPGGGVEFGELLEDALKREFVEETGLVVATGKFLFGCEFLQEPLHAIELFFEVIPLSGELRTGEDPELPIIQSVKFLSPQEIQRIPAGSIHGIFKKLGNPDKLRHASGFYRI
jgi:8-oxo-dGTP diphosphatase